MVPRVVVGRLTLGYEVGLMGGLGDAVQAGTAMGWRSAVGVVFGLGDWHRLLAVPLVLPERGRVCRGGVRTAVPGLGGVNDDLGGCVPGVRCVLVSWLLGYGLAVEG